MPSYFSNNLVIDMRRPQGAMFNLQSNLVPYFCIGDPAGDDVFLEGKLLDGEPIFNGRLFLSDGNFGTVIDTFPKPQKLENWIQRRDVNTGSYELVHPSGELVFKFGTKGNICTVETNIYKRDGTVALTGGPSALVADGIAIRFIE